jgi:hypothetical protein
MKFDTEKQGKLLLFMKISLFIDIDVDIGIGVRDLGAASIGGKRL